MTGPAPAPKEIFTTIANVTNMRDWRTDTVDDPDTRTAADSSAETSPGPRGDGGGVTSARRAGRVPGWVARSLLAAGLALPAFATPALAHDDGGGLHGLVLPAGVFLLGVVVLGASVALDARDAVDARYADAGVLVGAVCLIASIGIFWI